MVIFQRFSIGSWLISRCSAAAEGDLPGASPGRGAPRWTAPLAGYFAGGYLHGELLEGAVEDGLMDAVSVPIKNWPTKAHR